MTKTTLERILGELVGLNIEVSTEKQLQQLIADLPPLIYTDSQRILQQLAANNVPDRFWVMYDYMLANCYKDWKLDDLHLQHYNMCDFAKDHPQLLKHFDRQFESRIRALRTLKEFSLQDRRNLLSSQKRRVLYALLAMDLKLDDWLTQAHCYTQAALQEAPWSTYEKQQTAERHLLNPAHKDKILQALFAHTPTRSSILQEHSSRRAHIGIAIYERKYSQISESLTRQLVTTASVLGHVSTSGMINFCQYENIKRLLQAPKVVRQHLPAALQVACAIATYQDNDMVREIQGHEAVNFLREYGENEVNWRND